MTHNNNHNWIGVLADATKQINHSYNRSIGMASSQVTKKNESEDWFNLYSKYIKRKPRRPKFKINDLVKIAKHKLWTDKSYDIGWSLETFKVKGILGLNLVPYYRLSDLHGEEIEGTYTDFDLQLVQRPENSDD